MSMTAKRTARTVVALGTILMVSQWQLLAAEHEHQHDAQQSQPGNAGATGYPYSLTTDPVTGQPLGDKPVVYDHHGRELRFHDETSLGTFKADPSKYLPAVDRQMIQQQLPSYPLDTCMVSGDKLGGDMGQLIDFIYKNRLIRFCCPDCKRTFLKDPAKYLAKLDEAAAKESAQH